MTRTTCKSCNFRRYKEKGKSYMYMNRIFFKVPITPKNVFHLVQFLYGIRKNAAKLFAFGGKP